MNHTFTAIPGLASVSAAPTDTMQAAFWRQLLQQSPNGLVGLTAVRDETGAVQNFRYLFMNEASYTATFQLLPVQQHDATGELITEYFPSIRETGLWPIYLSVLETGYSQRVEQQYTRDGCDTWVSQTVSLFDTDTILLQYNDVTGHHKTARQLAAQTALLNNMLNSSRSAIVVFKTVQDSPGQPVDFCITQTNQMLGTLTDQPADSFVGKLLSDVYPLTVAKRDQIIRLIETGESIQREEFMPSVNKWFDLSLTRLNDGFVATLHDVTAFREATARVESQAALFDNVLRTTPNGLIVFEAMRDAGDKLTDFKYVEASQKLLKDLNRSRETLIGRSLRETLPSIEKSGIWAVYETVLTTGRPQRIENQYKADGIDGWFEISASKLNDGLVVAYTNITPAKQASQQLEAMIQELNRSNDNLQQFAYAAAHDLQEPLRKVQAFGDLLNDQFSHELGETALDLIRRMRLSASRMQTLVQDLLTYARLTTDLQLFTSVDLTNVLHTVTGDMEFVITDMQAQLTVGPLPVVSGDARQLQQLFQNLLSNALKFHRPGEPPVIRVSSRPAIPAELPINLLNREPGRFTVVEMTDDGIGFDEQYLDRIFTIFQRLHGQNQSAGTGIGLAICKKVADSHGGCITARSQPNQGATFTVWLPLVA